ncbi:MAG: glycosyltransferase family 4 protein [Chloroflexi bacterium]|nr:glycosyltransferase family 4 protein [Chloroflexota bacterium]
MAKAALLTLEPGLGGVPALARTVYRMLTRVDHSPQVIYRASGDVPTTSKWAMLKYFLSTPPLRALTKDSMPAIAVADYPLPPRYQYHLLRLAGSELTAPIAVAVSGSSHVGLPLALADRPYVLWVATLYEEELKGRAIAGDEWANAFMQHRDWPILQAQEQLVYEKASVILGLSPTTTEQIAARWPALKPKLRTVVYPVDTRLFVPNNSIADPPYLLLTARIRDPRKNVGLLLRAFAKVHVEFPRLRLVIAGDEPLPATQALATQLGVDSWVDFAGHVSIDHLVQLYQRATLFVFPSLQEGLGISILDAMACGLPVISTRCGGPQGIVENGVTGLLIPNNDEAALTQSICELLGQPAQLKAMGRAGREKIEEQFAREHIEAELHAAFADAFGNVY